MKPKCTLFLIFLLFCYSGFMRGQTTETFETEPIGSTTFTDNGKVFTIDDLVSTQFSIGESYQEGWNGTASVTATGTNLTYDWTPGNPAGDGTSSVSGLTAGQLTCTVSNGSTSTSQVFTITQPAVLSVGSTAFQGTYAHKYSGSAANNGNFGPNFTLTNFTTCQTSVTLAAHGSNWAGFTSVRYAIEVNGVTIANNLYGDYNVDLTPYIPVTSVKLRSDNTSSFWLAMHATVTINSPVASMPTTVPIVNDAVMCSSQLPYTAQATLTQDGTTLKWYSDENGSNLSIGTKVITTAGNHTLWVSQANASGCEGVRVPVTINVIDVNATTVVTSSHCLTPNGSIIVTPSGGIAPYTYLWQDGVTTKDRTNITFGDYSVTITDANNCSKVINATVGMTTDMVVTEVSKTNIMCNGDNTGALTIDVTGGTAPYTYQWPSNVVNGAGTNSISGLTAGNYNVVITDANGCITNATFSLTQNDPIFGYVSGGGYNCFLSENNITELEVYGGTGDYTYSWAPYGGTGKTATGLEPGIYYVTVTDSNGCEGIIEAYIENANLEGTVTTSQTNVSCNGGSNGTATITINSPEECCYEYNWYPPVSFGNTATGLSAGEYTVIVTDFNYFCQITHKFTITEPAELTATIAEVNNLETNTTVLEVTPTGGTAPYTYLWNTGATTKSIASYALGTYSCLVTDANGCTATLAEIEIVAPIAFEVTSEGNLCNGGSINVSDSEIGVNYQLQLEGTNVGTAIPGTGSNLSFTNITAPGTYTVIGIDSITNATTTMTDTVTFEAINYEVSIIAPTISCMDTNVTLSATLTNNDIITGFSGVFAPTNWAFSATNSDGLVNSTDAPSSISITSGNNGSGASGTTDYSIVIPETGTLSFNWVYNSDDGPEYDYPITYVNELFTPLPDFDIVGPKPQNGIFTISVTQGTVFKISMITEDNQFGAATITISNFNFIKDSASPIISHEWTASNGGVIDGPTNNLSVNAIASGTYTLTSTVNGCTFSDSYTLDFNAPITDVTVWDGQTWSNGLPQLGKKVVIDGNLVVPYQMIACELEITANGNLIISSEGSLNIAGKITNYGNENQFVVDNKATVIQQKDVANQGPATVKVNSAPLYRQDYTLWGSPVIEQNLRAFSPQTLYNRFSSYDESIGTVGDYVQELFTNADIATKNFQSGKGYLIRMPNNWTEYVNDAIAGTSYNGIFKGVPQNGPIVMPISKVNDGLNLVSNPYPSSIMIDDFFNQNPQLEETIYYWRKRNNASGSGYATYNAMGFVSFQPGLDQLGAQLESFSAISPGQGFFVKANAAIPVIFNNSMRSLTHNGVFLRSASQEKHRFKLNLSHNSAVVGQTLIGYAAGATANVDKGFDSSYFNDSAIALTSLIDGEEFIIQGLGLPFDNTSTVPMGFKTNTAGTYTISLSNFDGLFENDQNIYIKDNFTGNVHNLKQSSYQFATEEGVFNTRFEVVYNYTTLDVNNPDANANKVVVYKQNDVVYINTTSLIMQKVELYDVSGRLMQELNDINESTVNFSNLSLANQVLLVKITTVDNQVISKKIVY